MRDFNITLVAIAESFVTSGGVDNAGIDLVDIVEPALKKLDLFSVTSSFGLGELLLVENATLVLKNGFGNVATVDSGEGFKIFGTSVDVGGGIEKLLGGGLILKFVAKSFFGTIAGDDAHETGDTIGFHKGVGEAIVAFADNDSKDGANTDAIFTRGGLSGTAIAVKNIFIIVGSGLAVGIKFGRTIGVGRGGTNVGVGVAVSALPS